MNDDIFFTGEILSIFFSNSSNFYKVLLLQITDTNSNYGDSEIVVTGIIGDVVEGENYTFHGMLTTHPKYGEQLEITSYEKEGPTNRNGLVKFFSSDVFPGIGKVTAEKIVNAYPEDTINAILNNSSKLINIFSSAKRNNFIKLLKENMGQDRVLAELSKYGLSMSINLRMIEEYHEEAIQVLETTPYRLVEDIQGVGFKIADKIALELGIAADDSGRIRAGLLHIVITHSRSTGDTYLLYSELIHLTQELLETSRHVEILLSKIEEEFTHLLEEEKIQALHDKVFENSLYFSEEKIQNSLLSFQNTSVSISEEKIIDAIHRTEKKLIITYDDSQQEAIIKAINNNFSLLTGGPGTGKTTIIQGLIEVYAHLNNIDLEPSHYTDEVFPIILAAPTGRAARRMSEVTGLPAATLHRHLGIGTNDDALDSANDLSGSLLIVDEFSMVDTWLAAKLFAAIPLGMKVVFVGDSDQLPSVGPGQVFTDLFRLPNIASTRLDKIYRQSEHSTITDLAYAIKKGILPTDFTQRQSDRNFFASDSSHIPFLIEQIAHSWLNHDNDPFELQILSPMYRGLAGVDHLNHVLQEIFNPHKNDIEFSYKNMIFRAKDKVLHLVNDAENNVFNGDLGIIIELIAAKYTESKQDELVIDFDGTQLIYPRNEWYKLTLAYAMSIHKAQGSEFQAVVLPLVPNFSRMLQRNLLYTAITRAKQSLVLLGDISAFEHAVAYVGSNRRTYLAERFSEVGLVADHSLKEKEAVTGHTQFIDLTKAKIESGNFDPLIGLTERDFSIFKK